MKRALPLAAAVALAAASVVVSESVFGVRALVPLGFAAGGAVGLLSESVSDALFDAALAGGLGGFLFGVITLILGAGTAYAQTGNLDLGIMATAPTAVGFAVICGFLYMIQGSLAGPAAAFVRESV